MRDCLCQTSGHFCMACERELIAEIKQQDRERALRDREVKRDFITLYAMNWNDSLKSRTQSIE